MSEAIWFWVGFHILILTLLVVDLGFFHRTARVVKFKEASLRSAGWIALALLFNLVIYFFFGADKALQFFTGFIIEKSLSIDNLFLFLIFFLHFRIPLAFQHKILFWGIIGALVFRISLILMGVAIIARFHWMFYIFGGFLLFTGIKFAMQKEKKDPSKSILLQFFKSILPVATGTKHKDFFIKERGKWKVTSLFLALLMIECVDIAFALDSIPAIFAITTDPFIIYTSNVFAILGLRSLYFLIAESLEKMRYYKFGLAGILVFIGLKMLLADIFPISVPTSLAVIIVIMGLTTLGSVLYPARSVASK